MNKAGFSNVLLIALLFSQIAWSQENLILQKIKHLQIEQDSFYSPGLFPTEVRRNRQKRTWQDNNIFYSALIAYTLNQSQSDLSEKDNNEVLKLVDSVTSNFSAYRNRKGGPTYNFYQTHPENQFPQFKRLSQKDKFRLPDDLDDTSILYLALNNPKNKKNVDSVKTLTVDQTKLHPKLKSAFKKDKKSAAYRTWFADKMNQEFDICVMANALLLWNSNDIPEDKVDNATIQFIHRHLVEGIVLKKPHLSSPQYLKSSIILYHLSRTFSTYEHPLAPPIREKLLIDLKELLRNSKNPMEKVILLSSMYRLGESLNYQIELSNLEKEVQMFTWFNANLISGKPIFIKRLFGKQHPLLYSYTCEAYNWALILELQNLSGGNLQDGVLSSEAP